MSLRLPFLALLILATAALAATPPALLHYQGVLRDAGNHPLDGSHDMVFTFFNAEVLGDAILHDAHKAADGHAVIVTAGLFDVTLGGGVVTDGSGPGVYTSLTEVFADHGEVWMRIRVGTEDLAPRVRVASAGYALNASRLQGKEAAGFLDTSPTLQVKQGGLELNATDVGIVARGAVRGGEFTDSDGDAQVHLASGVWGIDVVGHTGGRFQAADNTGVAYVGDGYYGVSGMGSWAGGYFSDFEDTGSAWLGYGNEGIWASGTLRAGEFTNVSHSGKAYLADGDYGIRATGSAVGGYFADSDSSGYANVGSGHYGIRAAGDTAGGYFNDSNATGFTWTAYGDKGIEAGGNTVGGEFYDLDGGGRGRIGLSATGVDGEGNTAGGRFEDLTSTTYAYVGYGSYTVYGNGTKSFVQNHPQDPSKVLAYAALEGDEAGTYTRGTGRLVDGEARIALGETFRWVTNPDVGLTVQLTPRSAGASLYAASLTTEELVVRAEEGSAPDARFDFLVLGLRLGFEDLLIERDRVIGAPLPNRDDERAEIEKDPSRAERTPLARFARMREQAGERGALDLSRSRELATAVGRGASSPPAAESPKGPAGAPAARGDSGRDDQDTITGRSFRSAQAGMASLLPVSEPVQPGDVLVIDPDRPGALRPARSASDPGVVGVVAAEAGLVLGGGENADQGLAPTVTAGVVLCRVDASYGAIRPGTLLTTSPTPGHAMRADDPAPGTVLGKALESMEQGASLVRVLVMMR